MFALIFVAIAVSAEESQIHSDEVVTFYPTAAHLDSNLDEWVVPIRGIIFEPEEDSLRRRLLISLIRRSFGLKKAEPETEIFKQRVRLFLVDNERGKQIDIRIAGSLVRLSKSGSNGHFQSELRFPRDQVAKLQIDEDGTNGSLPFEAIMKPQDKRLFAGKVQLLEHRGFSIVSDIDDTIKHSEVPDKKELVRNTFLRPFKAAAGMAKLYQQRAREGWAFHYVSASPWQLYEPLSSFAAKEGFPTGTYDLRLFRMKDSTIKAMFTSSAPYKQQTIQGLLKRWPQRRFVLIGDSGEKDPEIYGDLARQHREQILAVLIRNVTSQAITDKRYVDAFQGFDQIHCQLFTDPSELEPCFEKWKSAP
ncbi:MAG: DUF2183 domain-containing protein [Planctomycetes bacterium]|nr:DUF2183 domain-containing protein [Planctomycetota bacterium]